MTVKEKKNGREKKLSESAASGIVALIFLIFGFQLAVFVMKVVQRPAAIAQQAAEEQYDGNGANAAAGSGSLTSAAQPQHRKPRNAQQFGTQVPNRTRLGGYGNPEPRYVPRPARKVESFPFNPNTVSVEDLVRLGLSEKQALTIENYRSKGGVFRSRSDFKKMYVVSDSLYERLEPFIDIPKLELNGADSTALVSLHGIGPYYARKIIEYRERLGGFHSPEQLLEIYGMDEERFAPIRSCVKTDTSLIRRMQIWEMSEESLASHPYIGRTAARSIIRYKKVCDSASWTLEGLVRENILDSATTLKLKHYVEPKPASQEYDIPE